jgi:hypothetical protein
MKEITKTSTVGYMKRFYTFLFFLIICLPSFSQNVGINATGTAPNGNAGLDVDFTNKGVLIPRVALTNTASFLPLSAHVPGMIVYNTATAGDVRPGFYYNNGFSWIAGFPTGTATGNMIYWNGTAWMMIPAGLPGQILQLNASSIPYWGGATGPLATLTTNAATLITGSSATTGANITADAGFSILTRGVCYSTTSNPTTANSILVASPSTGIGSFVSNLTGLLPATPYYVRAYATNSAVTSYGNEITFTTNPVVPTLAATTVATSITGSTAVSGGNVTATGGATILERGIVVNTAGSPTLITPNTIKVIDGTPGIGSFVSNITGLVPGTMSYYASSYATNSVGTTYGAQIAFKTALSLTSTTAATAIGATTATTGGVLAAFGTANFAWKYGTAYSLTSNAVSPLYVDAGTYPTIAGLTYVTNLTGLTSNTKYYIRAYAETTYGVFSYGPELSFTTTGNTAPVVGATNAVTNISGITGTSGGTITSDGGTTITAKGVCWATSSNPIVGIGNFTSDGTGSTTFVSNITGLAGSTTYHVRAYATNSIGTSYGTDVSFTTWVAAPYALFQDVGYGWVAYVAADGSGFIVSYDIPSTVGFGCSGTTFTGSAALGTGMANTNAILAACPTRPIAASVAASYGGGGYIDWYLPSNGDWQVIATNYIRFGLQSVGYNNYYTSSPYASNTYASSYFSTGSQVYASGANRVPGPSDYVNLLRAARSFLSVEVTTAPLTSFIGTGATSGGTLLTNGGPAVTAKGVCWSITSGPTVALSTKTNDGTGTAAFVSNITGLTSGTKYYVRAYATTSAGTAYGNEESFTATAATLATVSTNSITNLTATTATSGGNVTTDGNSPVTASGVCWSSTSTTPTMPNPNSTIDGSGIAAFISSVTGLVPGTTYYLRAYATNGVGTAYGAVETFTPSNLPVVSTDPMGSLVGAIAEGYYTVTSEGAGGMTAAGLVWGTSANPTVTTHTGIIADPYYDYISGTSVGFSWPLDMTGLTVGTVYHVRAYATNGSGTAYGADMTFTATAAVLGQLYYLNYQDGYVFSIDGTGTHGLMALGYDPTAPTDWGCSSSTVATGTAVGTGSANTDLINTDITNGACSSASPFVAFAAQIAKWYGVEWYLPSKDELSLLWTNRTADQTGTLDAILSNSIGIAPIWSSSQVDATHAWALNGAAVMVNTGLKTNLNNLLPIRSF